MKLASFSRANGNSYGAVVGDAVVDLGARLGARFPTLREAIAGDAVEKMKRLSVTDKPDMPLSAVRLRPPIPDPGKIICIGLNYREHAAESGAKIPEFPSLFIRLTNTLVAHNSAMVRPKLSDDFDFEGELLVVLAKGGRHINKAAALDHVLGYSCFNDGSIRDFQFKHSVSTGKNFPSTGGFGPWIVTRDEIPDPSALTLVTRLNGKEVQRSGTGDLIFDVPSIISYVSGFTALAPGDVIATGTPSGVGFARKPPLWLKPGDVIEVEISGIGRLSNPIVAEDAAAPG
jgi:2-keto-4-pentenoate hydratase/2-oxohepta-3-ene-1,7-dioic acid hydratase in catechol pathway